MFAEKINDIRVIGFATNLVLTLIALIGMSWEAKVQVFLLLILVVSFLNFVAGSFMPPSPEQQAKGFVGYSGMHLKFYQNLWCWKDYNIIVFLFCNFYGFTDP
jgi:hypothetical protein